MEEKLFFYYTNDFHSNFPQWPRVAAYLQKVKADREAKDQSYWIADIGDHVDRVHPIAEAYMGKANVELLNDAGYNLATLGNNEGITLAHDDLYDLYNDADFQIVCANLKSTAGANPEWLVPAAVVQSKGGVRVGVIGLTAPFNPFYNLLDWHADPPFETLHKYIHRLKQSADVIVLLSHLGLSEDQEIARNFPEIDVIIGGHTHHLLRAGEVVNDTLITAAGKQCFFAGEVILTWDHKTGKLANKEAYVTDISGVPKDLTTEQSLGRLTESADRLLSEPVIHTSNPIAVKWFQETELMRKLADTMKSWTEADCAMVNNGLLLDRFEAGDVTYKDIHRICPHPINPCTVELSGAELTEVVRASFTKEFMELKLKGFGFRGEVLGSMTFSGLEVETDAQEDGSLFVKRILHQSVPLNPEQLYKVALPDAFTFGRMLPEVSRSATKRFYLPEFIRDLLAETLVNHFGDV